jgi:hypothetical protein
MKKLLFAVPLVLLLAAGCNKATTVSSKQPFGIPPTPQTSTSTSTAAPTSSFNSSSQTKTANYLVIKEWGVQFKEPSDMTDLQYVVIGTNSDIVYFSTQSLVNLAGQDCAANTGPLAALSRSSSQITDGPVEYISKIDSYYYYYAIHNGTCSSDTKVNALVSSQTTELVSAFKTLSLTASTSNLTNQPGRINKVATASDGWNLTIDLLQRNLNWKPGVDSTGPFFLDQKKTMSFSLSSSAKAYNCTQGKSAVLTANNGDMTPTSPDQVIYSMDPQPVIYFDASGSNITAVYEQCLP